MRPNPQSAFVILYYGRWPHYWRFWAESAGANSFCDFLIVTDLPAPDPLPQNVRLVHMSYAELLSRLSQVLGFQLQPFGPHKLCDFRPFFGLAFPDLLAPYEYWGYCDLDLVFGDLTPLMEKTRSLRFDFVSPYTRTVGHCTLVRNTDRVNGIALNIPNLEKRSQQPESTFMDEGGISETACRLGGVTFSVLTDLDAEWARPRCFIGANARFHGGIAGLPGRYIAHYTNGKVMVHDERGASHEVLYFHFMGMKAKRFWLRAGECDPKEFSFTPCGMEPGLLEPRVVNTLAFRYRIARTHLPGMIYRFFRGLAPRAAIEAAKDLKRRVRSLSSVA